MTTVSSAPTAVGIIAEYNPFHLGHEYHIRRAKELSGAPYCIVIMSGDFVQRGEPAMFHKYLRTQMALKGGADLVIEMPSLFAVSSAEDFASCGVSLLQHLGVTSHLCFGSESGDLNLLKSVAQVLAKEPADYAVTLKEKLKEGMTFPEARVQALLAVMPETQDLSVLLSSPNNILGIEYLKAMERFHSTLKPVTITRQGQGYHDPSLDGPMASASALRQALLREGGSLDAIRSQIPPVLIPEYKNGRPVSAFHFSALLNYTLLRHFYQGESLSYFADWTPEMEHRMENQLLCYGSWEERVNQLKTKNITYTRASRALLHLVLGHRKETVEHFRQTGYAPYSRILGFRQTALPLLSRIKTCADIPLVTKIADAKNLLPPDAYELLSGDLYGSHIYQSVFCQQYHQAPKNEYTQPITIY